MVYFTRLLKLCEQETKERFDLSEKWEKEKRNLTEEHEKNVNKLRQEMETKKNQLQSELNQMVCFYFVFPKMTSQVQIRVEALHGRGKVGLKYALLGTSLLLPTEFRF